MMYEEEKRRKMLKMDDDGDDGDDDDSIDFYANKCFSGLSKYFCVFCLKSFHEHEVEHLYNHLQDHMKTHCFCPICDLLTNGESCPNSKDHPSTNTEDVEIINTWIERQINYQAKLIKQSIKQWISGSKEDRTLFAGCCVCEGIMSICKIPNLNKPKEQLKTLDLIRHLRSHLQYFPFTCTLCHKYQSYEINSVKSHTVQVHRVKDERRYLKEYKIHKLDQLVMHCVLRRDKINAQSNRSNSICSEKDDGGSERTVYYEKCLLCNNEFYKKGEFKFHHGAQHKGQPKIKKTLTKENYLNLFQVL